MSVTQKSPQGGAEKPLQVKDTPKDTVTPVTEALSQGCILTCVVLPQGMIR